MRKKALNKIQTVNLHNGFTLIELMLVIALLGVLVSLAGPNFTKQISDKRLQSSSEDLFYLLKFSRAEAMTKGKSVTVSQEGTWADGAKAVLGTTTELRFIQMERVTVTEANGLGSITFTGQGLADNAAAFTVCDAKRTAEKGYRIQVLASGIVVLGDITCS